MDRKRFDFLFVSTPSGDYWIPATDCPRTALSIKATGDDYERNIARPGKYERFKILRSD